MARGKREMPSRFGRGKVALISMALLLFCSVGGTLAWLATSTDPVVNTFEPGEIDVTVDDDFEENKKSNIVVSVPDSVGVAAYVRVALVATWENADHDPVAKQAELTLPTTLGSNWVLKTHDGFYYYTIPVEPGEETSSLFGNAVIEVPTDGDYHMNLQVLVDAIQANGVTDDGTKAVVDAWGVDPETLS